MKPGGLRLGTPAMTTRGFTESDFGRVAEIVDRAVQITKQFDKGVEGKKLKDFYQALGEGEGVPELVELRKEVCDFAGKFDLPWVQA